MPRLSVITPFHNTPEDLFQACADSVLSQGMTDFEWIIIDDGSEEKSAEVLKNFCERDSRIRLIVQEASGVSRARNRGLEEKSGEYFTFVDSDDIISPNFFEEALEVATRTQADIVYGVLSDTKNPLPRDDFSEIPERVYRGKDKDFLLRSVISGRDLAGGTDVSVFRPFAVAPRVYRSELFSDVHFETSMSLGEDSLFNACTVSQASIVTFSPHLWYTYIIHNSSTVYRHLSHGQALAMLSSYNHYREVAREKGWNNSDVGMRFLNGFHHIFILYAGYASISQIRRLVRESRYLPTVSDILEVNLLDYRGLGRAYKVMLRAIIVSLRYGWTFPVALLTKIRHVTKD